MSGSTSAPTGVPHPDLVSLLELLSDAGAQQSVLALEPENAEYGAAVSRVDESSVRWRVGKLTPTKVGMFVSSWRRTAFGSTEPFSVEGHTDFLIIAVREGAEFGAFVFPRPVLVRQGILSIGGGGGKRGFRVYPPWSRVMNAQAKRSQGWQCNYFVTCASEGASGAALLDRLRRGFGAPG